MEVMQLLIHHMPKDLEQQQVVLLVIVKVNKQVQMDKVHMLKVLQHQQLEISVILKVTQQQQLDKTHMQKDIILYLLE
jgi:hypothetical protein